MPIPQAAHYMNCPLHELFITGVLLYFNKHIDMKLYEKFIVVCCFNQGLLLQRELELGE